MQIYAIHSTGLREIALTDLHRTLYTTDQICWVDITNPGEADVRVMRDVFKFHPLAIEDSTNFEQRPKLEEYDGYLFLILNTARMDGDTLVTHEIDVFVGKNYLVTVHREADPAIDMTLTRLKERLRAPTPGYLLYVLMDVIVDGYFPIIEAAGERIEEIEDAILERPTPELLADLMELKRSLRNLWRVLWPQQEIFRYIGNHERALIQFQEMEYYFRDVHDHVLRIVDMVNTFRDTLTSVMDLYMSSTSNRLNHIVNRLTVITIAIGVLTVITGFYGMNFEQTWPPFSEPVGVLIALGMAVTAQIGLLLYFRNRRLL